MSPTNLSIGVVGGGIGGLAAAIALSRAGATVTVLEAASELGEIGAGIQMFGNVSRFLVRTGVREIIGDNLIQIDEVRAWGHDEKGDYSQGKLVGRMDVRHVVRDQGFPWWVVRRDHLHAGLAEGAKRHGAELVVGFRVAKLEQHGKGKGVTVTSEKGQSRRFDLVVGADGIKSAVRNLTFPDVKPQVASNVAAYRTVIPYEDVFREIPEARSRLGNTMDMWVGPGGYILLYPLTAGKELNVVTSFEQDRPVTQLEDVDLQEFRDHYRGWDPFILKILNMVQETKRWPLLVIPPVKTWSNEEKNIVLMGDAIHAMQNHMAQGAATSMEDGIFLGRIMSEVIRGTVTLDTAIHLYEKKRIPRAWHKQQSAFTQGQLASLRDAEKVARDESSAPEVVAWNRSPVHPEEMPSTYRSWLMFSSTFSVPGILYYDAEGDADFAVDEWLMSQGDMDSTTLVSGGLRAKWKSAIEDNGIERARISKAKL